MRQYVGPDCQFLPSNFKKHHREALHFNHCIWQAIRQHYGFQSCGSQLLDFADLKLEPDKGPEVLYQRVMAFIEDNLLKSGGAITHHNDAADTEGNMSPFFKNIVVVTWLRLINVGLPRLVKQWHGTELRAHTLASIKPEISQALSSLMDELHTSDDTNVLRAAAQSTRSRTPSMKPNGNRYERHLAKTCPLCKQAGRPTSIISSARADSYLFITLTPCRGNV